MSKPLSFHPEAINEGDRSTTVVCKLKRQEAADGFLRELRVGYGAIADRQQLTRTTRSHIGSTNSSGIRISTCSVNEMTPSIFWLSHTRSGGQGIG
ncbi:MAG: hypothetical protein R3C02_01830 [Planctomycetaceae bacterium]